MSGNGAHVQWAWEVSIKELRERIHENRLHIKKRRAGLDRSEKINDEMEIILRKREQNNHIDHDDPDYGHLVDLGGEG